MGIKVANNAFATLAAGISDSDTSITVSTGQGARFPVLGAGDYFYATLINTSNQLEIVECTARSGDVLTVVRAQEATAARAYDVGDRIEIRITAQTFIDATSDIETANIDTLNAGNIGYTGTLTGGTGVVNLGSGQFFKGANGNVGIGTTTTNLGGASSGNVVLTIRGDGVTKTGIIELQSPEDPSNNRALGLLRFFNGTNENSRIESRVAGNVADSGELRFFTRATSGSIAERMRIDSGGQLRTTVTGGTALRDAFASRAWVNFNGAGTVSIRSSGNVSSVTRTASNNYTVNFATSLPDSNYSATASNDLFGGITNVNTTLSNYATTSIIVRLNSSNGGAPGSEASTISVSVIR